MKILKLILLLAGIALILFGLYQVFIPQEIYTNGPVLTNEPEGFNDQTLGMIGLGIIAFIAGALLKNRR